jgi:UDP:flavonoid glycosyltransferase YjiC (YdhE family)
MTGTAPIPKRIVLTCWGSYGDLFPYLAVAIGLRQRGHAPVIAASTLYREIVEQARIEFQAVPPDVDPMDTGLMARLMEPSRGSEVIVREIVAPQVRAAYAALREAAQGADLLVTHPVTFAGPLVARSMKLPWISGVLAPLSFFSAHDLPRLPPYPPVAGLAGRRLWSARAFLWLARRITRRWTAPVRALAAELGVSSDADPLYAGQFSPHGTIAMFSPLLARPQPDWPPRTHATGFAFHDESGDLDAELRAFVDAGDPPIVFTLGTSAAGAPGTFYEESARAAAMLGRRAVLLVGKYASEPEARAWPSHVFAARYAPHAPLFRRAAATVHHGGIGTLAQALRAGRPTLVVPHAHDQPDNAARASRLGVARVLDARHYIASRVAAHLQALLDDETYARRARDVGAAIAAERGTDAACDVILDACRAGPPEA